jgi:hypothetical protein
MSEEPQEPLEMWAIYDRPVDFPDSYVVRRWRLIGFTPSPDPKAATFEDLEVARAWLRGRGLVCFARDLVDDASVIETWM